MNNYIKRIVMIICLTNIIAFLTLPLFFERSLGWILGSLASIIRVFWLAKSVKNSLENMPYQAKVKTVKSYYISYLLLFIYAFLIVKFIKPDIIFFGLGMLSAQIAIYLNELGILIKNCKIFRGKDG